MSCLEKYAFTNNLGHAHAQYEQDPNAAPRSNAHPASLDPDYNTPMLASPASIRRIRPVGTQADLNQYSLTPRSEGGEWVYTYDANGNQTERVQDGPADVNGDYTHNAFDVSQFNAWFNAGDPEADYNGDGEVNFFDLNAFLADFNPANGTDLEHWHYSYDFRNQLIGVTSAVGAATPVGTTNTYDALARRVLETSLGETRQLVYGCVSHWEVLEQIDLSQSPERVLTTHVYGIGTATI